MTITTLPPCEHYQSAADAECDTCGWTLRDHRLAEMVREAERAKVDAEIADCHGVIASLWARTNPEETPADLVADIEAILGAGKDSCGNSICANLTAAEAQLAEQAAKVRALETALRAVLDLQDRYNEADYLIAARAYDLLPTETADHPKNKNG